VKIAPLPVKRVRQHALLDPGYRRLVIETRWGRTVCTQQYQIEHALAQLDGLQCYVLGNLERLKHTTGARSWAMETWRGRETGMVHLGTGVRVATLRHALDKSADPFGDLTTFLDWVAKFGVRPGTLSSMAWQLFRASLDHEVQIGVDPWLAAAAFFGGRQGCKTPKVYKHQKLVDIKGAYPFQMARRPYALDLRRVAPSTALDRDVAGLARATVWVPHDLPYPPLPVRVGPEAIQFRWGSVEGVYPWTELAAAAELGCTVRVSASWAPRRELDLFGPWWSMGQPGRDLPGAASQLAKALLVCTWGQFGMDGEHRATIHWADEAGEHPYVIEAPEHPMPHAWMRHVAAETTSRVRTQMLTEGLYGVGTARPAHWDTDGFISARNAPLPVNTGDGFGQWRVKWAAREVEIKGPQFYRYTCSYCGLEHAKWHYCASGMPEPMAARAFKKAGALATGISFLSFEDKVLPDTSAYDHDRITELITEARGMGVEVGEGW
jgi:hypothetical protein